MSPDRRDIESIDHIVSSELERSIVVLIKSPSVFELSIFSITAIHKGLTRSEQVAFYGIIY